MPHAPPPVPPADPPLPEDGRRRRARLRKDATHEALVRAAAVVYARDGYLRATPAAIAQQAGVTRATFYQHFPSKSDAFTAVFDQLLERLDDAVRGVDLAPTADPPEVQLTSNLLRVLDILLEDRDLARLLLVEARGQDAMLADHVRAFFARVQALVRTALVEGAEAGLVRPVAAHIVAHAMLGAVQAVLVRHLGDAGGEDAQAPVEAADRAAIAKELLAFCLCGVASDELRGVVLRPN